MLVNENKLMDMIRDSRIHVTNNEYYFIFGYKTITVRRDSFVISNDKMMLLNQRHDGHLYQYAEDAYKRQELKDFL